MAHLNRLTLYITSNILYHRDVLDILKASDLPRLRYLRLFLFFNVSPSAIEELFPLLSRLDEFSIRSNWYRELDSQGWHFSIYTSWRLKRLAIDHAQIQYFPKHFPSLEEMAFKCLMVKWILLGESFGEGMLSQLLDMPRLKAITVSGIRDTDAVEYRTEDAMGLEVLWKEATVAKMEDERELRWWMIRRLPFKILWPTPCPTLECVGVRI